MGQALYRKYRPKSLDEIVGQEHISDSLKHALKENNVSHAYLFTGPKGVGKTSVARILAYAVNNLPYSDEGENHLDIIEIDAASHRGIEDIVDLRQKVNVSPSSANYKVYIIDEVHMLSSMAFNGLLKTLEEPPAHAIFILATTELYKVPATIISRTQRFSFHLVPKDVVATHLKMIAKSEKIKIDDAAILMIAEHGHGSFRDSISLLDQIRNQTDTITVDNVTDTIGLAPVQIIDSIKDALSKQDKVQLLRVLSDVSRESYDPKIIATQLSDSIRSDLFDDHTMLSQDKTIEILSSLLSVPISSSPSVALELALISGISSKATGAKSTTTEALTKDSPPKSKVLPKKIKMPATKAEDSPVVESTTSQEPDQNPIEYDQDEAWHAVLDIIKKDHNTLYSVLRVAQPTWEDERIIIAFQFPFHQKRLLESSNNEIVSEAIKDVIQKTLIIEPIVDENIKVEVIEELPEVEEESPLDSISNIFGSAELLES